MTNWRKMKLGDVIELHSGGTPSKQQPKYWNGDLPWVSPKDVKVDRLHVTEETVTEEAIGNGTREVAAGTLLLVVRSMILAREVPLTVAQRRMCFNQDIKAITPKGGITAGFLAAWFFANRSAILGIVDEAGHGTKRIQTDRLLALPINLPSLASQKRITSIVGAYDDLIDVNRRRIALLEEMARRLFVEWFVRFRYPGHEDLAIVDTPDGPLPHGWRRVRLDEIASVNANAIKPINAPDRIGYIDIASVTCGDIKNVEWQAFCDAPGRARRRVRDGSIIWSTVRPNRRSYALIVKPEENLIVSTGFAVLDPRGTSSSYLYHYVTTDKFVGYLAGSATGAAYPAVTGATFERALVVLPPKFLDEKFNAVAEPMLTAVYAFRRQNIRLAASRDLLLPRLISGKLSISAAEHELDAVA